MTPPAVILLLTLLLACVCPLIYRDHYTTFHFHNHTVSHPFCHEHNYIQPLQPQVLYLKHQITHFTSQFVELTACCWRKSCELPPNDTAVLVVQYFGGLYWMLSFIHTHTHGHTHKCAHREGNAIAVVASKRRAWIILLLWFKWLEPGIRGYVVMRLWWLNCREDGYYCPCGDFSDKRTGNAAAEVAPLHRGWLILLLWKIPCTEWVWCCCGRFNAHMIVNAAVLVTSPQRRYMGNPTALVASLHRQWTGLLLGWTH